VAAFHSANGQECWENVTKGTRMKNWIVEGENGFIFYYSYTGNWLGRYDLKPIFDAKEDGGH
jgi:hypothetical protein